MPAPHLKKENIEIWACLLIIDKESYSNNINNTRKNILSFCVSRKYFKVREFRYMFLILKIYSMY